MTQTKISIGCHCVNYNQLLMMKEITPHALLLKIPFPSLKRTDHQFKYVLILPVTGLTGCFQQQTVIQSDHEGKIYAATAACR